MAYTVLARKWRPTGFNDFVGQEAIARTLRTAVETGRIAHAYLFAGERGTGKTSMVRVFAKALNCERGPTGDPCNKCDICLGIQEGRDLDVLEIDGASYRKVEEISEILKNVGFRPARARSKIYIIDEVHMLSEHAFNALLKTLEEPPAHVKFIFATTEPDELLDTIKSRCQRFDFRKISTEAIAKRLRQVCDTEKIQADDRALLTLAKNARGGMRDALTSLDQVVAFSPTGITGETVNEVLGLPAEDSVSQIMDAVASREVPGCLKILDGLIGEGKDPLDVLAQLTDYVRDLVVLQATKGTATAMGLQVENTNRATEQAHKLRLEHMIYMIQIFSEARKRARERAQGRIAAEIALIKCALFEQLESLGELLRTVDELASRDLRACRVAQTPSVYGASGGHARPSESAAAAPQSDVPQATITDGPPLSNPPGEEGGAPPLPPKVPANTPLTTDMIHGLWPHIVLRVKLAKPRIGMWLARSACEKAESSALVVGLPAAMVSFERQQVEANRQIVEQCASEVVGRPVTVSFVSASGQAESARQQPPEPEQKAPRADVYDDPVVKKAIALFEARILNVEE